MYAGIQMAQQYMRRVHLAYGEVTVSLKDISITGVHDELARHGVSSSQRVVCVHRHIRNVGCRTGVTAVTRGGVTC